MEHNASVLGQRLYALDRDTLAALGQALCQQLTEYGSYHGGIRPDNLFYADDGTVALGEPAKRESTGEWTAAELEYMAPEVFWNGTHTPAADVYSIGMLLYAGVNQGQMPFCAEKASAADSAEALRRRMNGDALEMPKTAGKQLARIIEKATQFRADDRYESPAALSEALDDYRQTLRTNIPAAREMFEKPRQELTEVEQMLLAILTEKQAKEDAEKAAAEAAAREAEEAAQRAAAEQASQSEAEKAPEEDAPAQEPSDETPEEDTSAEAAKAADPEPDGTAEAPAEEPSTLQKAGKKAGVDPALVEAISASVAARMAEPESSADARANLSAEVHSDTHKAEEARISQQLEQMDWIGHNDDDARRSHSGWIVAGLCIVAVVLGALIFHSIGTMGRQRHEILTTAASPEITDTALVSASPAASAEPTETPAPEETPAAETPEPTATPTPAPEHRYEVVLSNASWETAKQEAEAKGGYLAVIESGEELQKIASLAAAQGAQYVWIGLSRDSSGALNWVKNTESGYISWAAGEPSVRDSYTGNAEDYVLLANKGGTWLYNDCIGDPAGSYPRFYSGVLGYVIEYDK